MITKMLLFLSLFILFLGKKRRRSCCVSNNLHCMSLDLSLHNIIQAQLSVMMYEIDEGMRSPSLVAPPPLHLFILLVACFPPSVALLLLSSPVFYVSGIQPPVSS